MLKINFFCAAKLFLCASFCSLFALFFIGADLLLFKLILLFSLVAFLCVNVFVCKKINFASVVLLLFVLVWLFLVLLFRSHGLNAQLSYFIAYDAFAFLAALFFVSDVRYFALLTRFYWISIIFTCFFVALDFADFYSFGGAILGGASVNYVTSFILVIALLLIGFVFKYKGVIASWYLLPVLFFSIYFDSRFSMLVSAGGFLLLMLVAYASKSAFRHTVFLFFCLASLIGFAVFSSSGYFCEYLSVVCNDPRVYIWNDFFSSIDYLDYFFGVNFEDCCEVISGGFKNNPHNSLVRSVAFYGFGSAVFVVLHFIVLAVFFISPSGRVYAALTALWMLRGWSDSIIFPYYFDFLFFSLVVLMFQGFVRPSKVRVGAGVADR